MYQNYTTQNSFDSWPDSFLHTYNALKHTHIYRCQYRDGDIDDAVIACIQM